MPKRGNGEGSIYRRKDGRWAARYTLIVDGRSIRRWIYCNTREEAARRLREAIAARERAGCLSPTLLRLWGRS